MFKETKKIKLNDKTIETHKGKHVEKSEHKTAKAAEKEFAKLWKDLNDNPDVRIEGTAENEITLLESE